MYFKNLAWRLPLQVASLLATVLLELFLHLSGLVGFYGISTVVGYLMLNYLYTYILNIYDLVWFGLMAYQPL